MCGGVVLVVVGLLVILGIISSVLLLVIITHRKKTGIVKERLLVWKFAPGKDVGESQLDDGQTTWVLGPAI